MFRRKDYLFVLGVKADVAVGVSLAASSKEGQDGTSDLQRLLVRKFSSLRKIPWLLRTVIWCSNDFLWMTFYPVNFALFARAVLMRLREGAFELQKASSLTVLANAKGRNFGQLMENSGHVGIGNRIVVNRSKSFPAVPQSIGKSVFYLALLSWRDLWGAFLSANRQIYLVRRCCGKENVLHALKAFDWFAYRQSLMNCLPCREVVFVSIRDRWFFLYQSLGSVRKVLVQHGNIARGPDGRLLTGTDLTPYRQTAVNKIFCYDKAEEHAFRQMIRTIGEVEHFTPRIVLAPLQPGRKSVLLICCVLLYAELETSVIRLVAERHPEVDLYVKPHPTASDAHYRKLLRRIPFHLIMDISFFPDADVVISYHSTLAMEYEALGKRVVYTTDMNSAELAKRIDEVLAG